MDTQTLTLWYAAQAAAAAAAGGVATARSVRAGRARPIALLAPIVAAPVGALVADYMVRLGAHFAAHGRGLPSFGGAMAYGALAGYALTSAALAAPGKRWRALGDAVGPLACLVALGRVGCFCGGCEAGVCTAGWRHPVALYEGALALGAWRVAHLVEARWPHREEARFAAFALMYALGRAAIEVLRDPGPLTGAGVTVAQWVSVGVACAIGLRLSGGRSRSVASAR